MWSIKYLGRKYNNKMYDLKNYNKIKKSSETFFSHLKLSVKLEKNCNYQNKNKYLPISPTPVEAQILKKNCYFNFS